VVKHALREGLTTRGGTQVSSETERFHDGKVSLDSEERSTGSLLFRDNHTTTTVKDTVDTTNSVLRASNFDKVDGFLETGLTSKDGSVNDTTAGGDNLTSTTVNGISVQDDIHNVETNGTHVFITENTFLGGPLETSDARVLDFVQVLDSLGDINKEVGARGLGTETPNLTGVSDIPSEFISKDTGTGLEIILGVDLAGFNGNRELLLQRLSLHKDTVVLVGRLGQADHVGLGLDSLTELHDGVTNLDGDLGVVFLKILQANFEVELTSTSNNVFTRFRGVAKNARVRLGETLQTFNKLGKIVGVLDLDGDLHDRGDGELHDLQVVSSFRGGDGTRLEQELVNTDKTDNVTGRAVFDSLNLSTHHQNGTLNVLDEQIVLLARNVVGALDTDLLTGTDSTREDTTESVETTLVGSGNHLGDVKHEGGVGIAVLDTQSALIIVRTLVKHLHTVALSSDGRGEVDTDHFKQSISGRQELTHDGLEEGLTGLLLLLRLEGDSELLNHGVGEVGLAVHDGIKKLVDGVQTEHVEGTLKGLAVLISVLGGPLLGGRVEEVVTPELDHHLLTVDTELLGVSVGELTEGESPTVETGTESNGTLFGVDLEVTKSLVQVGRDNDVDVLNGTQEGVVEGLLVDLEFEKSTVNLVDDNNRLNTLTKGLTKHSLGLHTDTVNGVDDDKGTVSDTEGSSDLRREVDVTRGVNKVDQEFTAVGLLLDFLNFFLSHLKVHGDGSGLDGNTTLLLIGTGVHDTLVTGSVFGNNTGPGDKGVREGTLSVVDVRNDGHVTHVSALVHKGTKLIDSEIDHS